jgi:predicted NUDIX family phosphoesterase
MPDPMKERVLVVPASLLDELGRFQGFCTEVDQYLDRLLDPRSISFRPRHEMEQDPSFKQLIPYCILRSHGAVFRYTRGKKMGEKRLHDLESIGVGGHIPLDDDRPLIGGTAETYTEAMHRELNEEVSIETPYQEHCVGLINDDRTLVGQVHLGIVHLLELDQPRVRKREAGLTQAGFVPLADLRCRRERLETWSQFCLDALFRDPRAALGSKPQGPV